MDGILIQLLLLVAGLVIMAFAIPARRRLRDRYNTEPTGPALVSKPRLFGGDNASARAGAGVGVEEENPLEYFLEEALRRGRRPIPADMLRLQQRLERENWPVPNIEEILDEFDRRREEIRERKVQRYQAAQGGTAESSDQTTSFAGQPNQTDIRTLTLQAITQLPKSLPPIPESEAGVVPLLFDGARWYGFKLIAGSHYGIFGLPRSGKGNALQHIALNLLRLGPQLIKLLVLDAKAGLDYSFCEKIEHAELYANSRIMDGANAALDEMERRNEILKEADYRNTVEYYQRTGVRLPYLVVIADEIADFTDEQRSRLATFARMSGAAGGILLVATQYPTTDILPSQIQANIGNRIVFRLAASEHIRVALRRQKNDGGKYDPSVITKEMPGVAVWRMDGGAEVVGRVPEVSDGVRSEFIAKLVARWPKAAVSLSVPRSGVPRSPNNFELKIVSFEGNGAGEQPGERTGNTTLNFDNTEGNAGGTPEIDDEMIAAMLRGGLSSRKIMKLLKGKNEKRLERINRIEQELKALEGDAV